MMMNFNVFSMRMKNRIFFFFEIFIALKLSQCMFMVFCSIPQSFSICFIHRSCVQQIPTTTYSASIVDKDIKFCFLISQAIRQSLIKKKKTRCVFSIFNIYDPVSVEISSNHKRRIIGIPLTIIKSLIYVTYNSFNSS